MVLLLPPRAGVKVTVKAAVVVVLAHVAVEALAVTGRVSVTTSGPSVPPGMVSVRVVTRLVVVIVVVETLPLPDWAVTPGASSTAEAVMVT